MTVPQAGAGTVFGAHGGSGHGNERRATQAKHPARGHMFHCPLCPVVLARHSRCKSPGTRLRRSDAGHVTGHAGGIKTPGTSNAQLEAHHQPLYHRLQRSARRSSLSRQDSYTESSLVPLTFVASRPNKPNVALKRRERGHDDPSPGFLLGRNPQCCKNSGLPFATAGG